MYIKPVFYTSPTAYFNIKELNLVDDFNRVSVVIPFVSQYVISSYLLQKCNKKRRMPVLIALLNLTQTNVGKYWKGQTKTQPSTERVVVCLISVENGLFPVGMRIVVGLVCFCFIKRGNSLISTYPTPID